MDIAALGLSIDSSPVERAVTALRQLPGAARSAAAGADQLAGSAEREARAMTQSTASLNTNARAAQVAGSAVRAANENIQRSGGLARHEMINLSRQVQDIGVSLASGQSPFTVLVQQGTQVGDIFANTNGTLRGFASQIASMITPMRLLGLGVVAIGAAAYAGLSYWKSYALALDDLSHITGTATAELSRLQTAASIKGIGQDDFAGGMRRFADAVYDAKAGANDLATLLRLNGKTVSDTAGTLDTVAELIRNARDDQQRLQILQQAGLPATMEWVRLTRGGAEGLREAKAQANEVGGVANKEMVMKAQQFTEAWNGAWTNFGISMRRSVYEGYSLLQKLIEQGREAIGAFDKATGGEGLLTVGKNLLKYGLGTRYGKNDATELYGGFTPGARGETSGGVRDATWLAQQQRAIQLEQQRISLLGEAATAADHRREVALRLQAADLAGIKLTDTQIEKIKRYAQEERSLAETQQTLSALGNAATDAERYAARLQELNVALGRNTISQEQFNRAVAFADPLFSGFASTLETNLTGGLASIVNGTKSAKDAFSDMALSIVNEIEKMIIKLLIVQPLIQSLGGLFGGATGGAGSPMNIVPFAFANGGIMTPHGPLPLRSYAMGGIADSPQMALYGEGRRPEAYVPLPDGRSIPVKIAGAGGSGVVVNMNITNNAGSDIQARQQSQPRQNSDGSISLDVVIERAVRNAVNSDVANNGPMTQGLARRFNLNSAAGIA